MADLPQDGPLKRLVDKLVERQQELEAQRAQLERSREAPSAPRALVRAKVVAHGGAFDADEAGVAGAGAVEADAVA